MGAVSLHSCSQSTCNMYAIVLCNKCKNRRIIDRSSLSSNCPYCDKSEDHSSLKILFEDRDQRKVRDVLGEITFATEPSPKKTHDADPFSTLVHRYEKCTDTEGRMTILSDGLTKIFGTFTLEDVESVDPRYGKQMLKAMLENCLVHEVRPGRYST